VDNNDTNSTSQAAPAWWESVQLRLGARLLAWGGEHEVILGWPMDLTLNWNPARLPYNSALGLTFQLPPDPEDPMPASRDHEAWSLRMQLVAPGKLAASQEWHQFAVQRYTGETLLMLTQYGQPIKEAHCLLRFTLSEEDQNRYDYMIEALGAENLYVVHAEGGVVGRVSSAFGLSPTGRLETRWAALQKAHEQLASSLPPILASPHAALQHAQKIVEWSEHMPLHALRGATPASGTSWMAAFVDTAGAATHLPRRFALRTVEERPDTPANRYVRNTIDLIISEARNVEKDAAERTGKALARLEDILHPRWRQWLEGSITHYERIAEAAKHIRKHSAQAWLSSGVMKDMPSAIPRTTDLVWRDNAYYRRIRTIRDNLERELKAADNAIYTNDKVTPAASINSIYELWLAMILLKTLNTTLRCDLLKWGGRAVFAKPTRSPTYLPNRGSCVELRAPSGQRLVLRFDMEYASKWLDSEIDSQKGAIPYGVDRRLWPNAKGRPDLALEVWNDEPDSRVPQIAIFDATWSSRLDTRLVKFLYRESIRDFTRHGISGKPARPVVAAWVVYPGPIAEADHEDDYSMGQLPLDPGPNAEATLAEYLKHMPALSSAL
jgi:hypothetical protein